VLAQDLEVPGFEPAVLYVPPGEQALPLVVANHGAGGDAEGECHYWRGLIQQPAAVLCLRGTAMSRDSGGYFYRNHLELEKELKAALTAVRAKLGARLQRGGGLYAGFSQGAIMGAAMIGAYGDTFAALALVEGGYEYWSPQTAQQFARSGGQRVLFACGTQSCERGVVKPTEWLERAGVHVQTVFAPVGHTPGGAVREGVRGALPWLLSDW
jgi:predicted esterase